MGGTSLDPRSCLVLTVIDKPRVTARVCRLALAPASMPSSRAVTLKSRSDNPNAAKAPNPIAAISVAISRTGEVLASFAGVSKPRPFADLRLNARAPSSQDHRGTRERTAPDASSLSFGDNRGWSLTLANKATTQAQCGNDQCQCQRNFRHRIPLCLTALCGSSATSRVFSSRSRRSAASSHQKEPNRH